MAGKECWSVGKGRGKVLSDFGGGGRVSNEEETKTHPGVSTHPGAQNYLPENVQILCFAGCPYKTPLIQPKIFRGCPRGAEPPCQAHGGKGQGSICFTSILEAKPSVDSATKAEVRHRCRAMRTRREGQELRLQGGSGASELGLEE